MMKNNLLSILVCSLLLSCNSQSQNAEETPTSGEASVLVDETIFPIADDQLQIFSATYPQANITLVSKPEGELLPDFLSQKTSIAILPRSLTLNELSRYEKSKVKIRATPCIIEAVAFIVNKQSSLHTISIKDIKDGLQGTGKHLFVFDNAKSSVVTYLKRYFSLDSFSKKSIYAANNSQELIKYISKTPNGIGVIGVNWLNQAPPEMEESLQKISILKIRNQKGELCAPNQNDIADELYPFVRKIFFYDCEGKAGLGLGFASFVAGDRGQRIVLKSGLLPYKIPPREVIIKKELTFKK